MWSTPLVFIEYIVEFIVYTVEFFEYIVEFIAYTVEFIEYTVQLIENTEEFIECTIFNIWFIRTIRFIIELKYNIFVRQQKR